jgi:hypothetical protein
LLAWSIGFPDDEPFGLAHVPASSQ